MVREPASFDEVAAAPGGGAIQAAIDRCRVGGSILLQPGTYTLSAFITIAKEVHLFGRGLARLRTVQCDGIRCGAATATVDGLIVERPTGRKKADVKGVGVAIVGGSRLRLQNSEVTGPFDYGLTITEGADPVITASRCVRARSLCRYMSLPLIYIIDVIYRSSV